MRKRHLTSGTLLASWQSLLTVAECISNDAITTGLSKKGASNYNTTGLIFKVCHRCSICERRAPLELFLNTSKICSLLAKLDHMELIALAGIFSGFWMYRCQATVVAID